MKIALLTTDNREHFKLYDAPRPMLPPPQQALLDGFAKIPELEIHVISCSQLPMEAPSRISGNAWFHLLHVPKIGWLRTGYQGCVRAIRQKLRELQPDVVHGQGTERECAISASFSGFPNVTTIHGNMAALANHLGASFGSYHWLTARLEDFSLRRTDGVLCNSAYTENLVRTRTRRTWRVANAVRKEFLGEVHAHQPPTVAVILNVGVISPRKRQRELLACARRLHERGARTRWNFFGEANASDAYAARFLAEIREGEAEGYAHYLGTRSTDEIVQDYDRASALVHFPTEEAFGLVVAEALARNLKFFGSDVGGIRDISSGVEGAELFQPDDWPGLEGAILRWEKEGFVLPQRAAGEMSARYAPSVIAVRHLQIYREVLNTRA